MIERLSATSRNDIDRAFRDNILFRVVKTLEQPLVASQSCLRLTPEEVFQEVMGWLDRISRTEDEEELAFDINNAWAELWQQFSQLAPPNCPDSEIEQSVGVVLSFLLTCLIKLSDETLEGCRFYAKLSHILACRMHASMKNMYCVVGCIIDNPFYRSHNEELNEWIVFYMLHSSQTLTTSDGKLKTTLARDGGPKGRKKTVLFANVDKEKDVAATQVWSDMFRRYVASRNRSGVRLDTKKDNFLLLSMHAFKQYWERELKLKMPTAGAAYYAFLVDDCHFELGTDPKGQALKSESVCDALTRVLKAPLGEFDGNYLKVCQFMKRRD